MANSNRPFISCEDFLKEVMANETKAGFADFINLWQSSETLRLQIKRVVENNHPGTETSPTSGTEIDGQRIGHRESSLQREVTEGIIDYATIAPHVERQLTQSYGGLSRKELFMLLEKHKAGNRDLGVYLLIRAWKKNTVSSKQSLDVRLKRLTLACLERAIAENRADFFRDIAEIIEFLQKEEFRENGQWNHGPGQWWQFQLLLYLFEHPKEKYVIREFAQYFEQEVGANDMPSTRTLRAFCQTNGIALDSTPGAPKKTQS